MTASDLVIRCSCGEVEGRVTGASPSAGNHLVCYCDDCQAFPRHLGQQDRVLDEFGGTDIYQTSIGRVQITKGKDRLACIRLSPKGLLRWYANCCGTPIANTMPNPSIPFIGLVHACLQDGADGTTRAEILGPIRGWANKKFASGDRSTMGSKPTNFGALMGRFAKIVLLARLGGAHKRTAFFQPDGKTPVVEPKVLTEAERKAAYAK